MGFKKEKGEAEEVSPMRSTHKSLLEKNKSVAQMLLVSFLVGCFPGRTVFDLPFQFSYLF